MTEHTTWNIFDCGCIPSRPKEASCRSYGTRWRCFLTSKTVKLKCRDCGRIYTFALSREGIQTTHFDGREEMDRDGVLDE